jgi:pimeloyl-ACP methyl ester carboxylesterase
LVANARRCKAANQRKKRDGQESAYRRFCEVRDTFLSILARVDTESAMQRFIGFWAGEGAWGKMPVALRAGILQMTDKIVLDWQASFGAEADLHALETLGTRTLLLSGDRSPEPMLRLVKALTLLMPASKRVVVPSAGHLLPATHPSEMIEAMLDHIHAEAERRMQ